MELTTRNNILVAVRDALRARAGDWSIDPSRIELRAIYPHQIDAKMRVGIAWRFDKGGHRDGNMRERVLTLIVAVMFETDPSREMEQQLQASELYDLVHAELETIAEDGISGLVMGMNEADPGIEHSQIEKSDRGVWMGSVWAITYRRQRATT